MTEYVRYDFSGPLSSLSGGNQITTEGSIFVLYDLPGQPRIATVSSNLKADQYSFPERGTINLIRNLDGSTDYRVGYIGNSQFSNENVSLSFTFDSNQRLFSKFDTVQYTKAVTDYTTIPATTKTLTFGSTNLSTTSAITNTVPCFAGGTLIRTTMGDVPVEHLSVGQHVVTAAGEARPIRWIGRRTLDCSRHATPEAVWPVRILADAFGPSLPARDLVLSPDHAVRVTVLDDVLIPVKHLLNDATIAQMPVAEITYWHVELDSHDVLLAESLPAESFLDTGVRAGFENGSEHTVLHPDFSPLTLDDFSLPLVQDGPIVDAVRTRLIARAQALGWTLTDEDDLHLVADGVAIRPERDGTTARFSLPAGAGSVRLTSRSFVPERVRVGAGDGRRLGVPVRGVSVIDGHGVIRSLPIGSSLFETGFSFIQDCETNPWRWTVGAAALPAVLWAGSTGIVTLVIETAPDRGTLQAWLAPATGPTLRAGADENQGATRLSA
ncbi:Hint domain-containing protein [Methylobacterium indicum]|uniref:Hint domain-containing protein n=1 Tax=Methylobacterium indicum TaxID=1775910 RepID=UPI0009E5BA15|nr:Hint domain-containing protein [Methylobacterium indicum]